MAEWSIRWDGETRETILAMRDQLEKEGMICPTIRTVLYRLMSLPHWEKRHYTTLCRKLGEWRDKGLVPWGLFSDAGGGTFYRPLLSAEIRERIKALEKAIPVSLMPDGYIHALFVEHEDLVDNIARWLDWRVPVVSSKGQLRRENLQSAVEGWKHVAEGLEAKGIECLAIVDWDDHGKKIFKSHERWLKRVHGLHLDLFGITGDQVRAAGLPVHEDHQLDGVIGAYGPVRFRQELRKAMGFAIDRK